MVMRKFDVQIALEGIAEARAEWDRAIKKFDADVEFVMTRLINEAAVNMMSPNEVAQFSGFSVDRIRRMMRANSLDPKKGKRLLAKQAAEALAENAALLGVEPWEMDHMSPLMYLPMGETLRQQLKDKQVARVTEPSPEDEVERLTAMLYTLGFCPKDGDSMPCFTCGDGL